VNGKTRLSLTLSKEQAGDSSLIEQLVRDSEVGSKWLSDKKIRKTIVAKKGQLVNFVL
jgi:leucyl-tRNA synthetase